MARFALPFLYTPCEISTDEQGRMHAQPARTARGENEPRVRVVIEGYHW